MENAVIDCILTRASVRSFKAEPVPRETLEIIVKAGLYAPSALNQQAWQFTVVTSPNLLGRLNDVVAKALDESARRRIEERNAGNGKSFFYNAPALIVLSLNDEAIFPFADAGCAVENMYLAAHAQGFGSCWINQLTGDASRAAAVRDVLSDAGVPSNHTVYGCLAVGYTDKLSPPRKRVGRVIWAE